MKYYWEILLGNKPGAFSWDTIYACK